jgi:alpha/beta superfamily hydrolase
VTRSVLVLHPHPDHGGDRHNPVVVAVDRAATSLGWHAIRPALTSGDLEVAAADAARALDGLDGPIAVVGYSFGAGVASRLVDARIDAWVLVAPPFGLLLDASAPVGSDARPKLLLVPAHDQLSPPATAEGATRGWAATEVEVVDGADHFLAGATDGVAARACAWIAAL